MIETEFEDIFVENTKIFKKTRTGKLIELCQWVDNVGYYQCSFRTNGKKHYVRVHRLIAKAYIPNPNNYPMINHIDGNKLNNAVSNLEWCSNSYNTKQAYDSGVYVSKKECPIEATHKITNEVFGFKSIRECAKQLCINRKTLTSILKGVKQNNYDYNFRYIEPVSTIPDECKGVE